MSISTIPAGTLKRIADVQSYIDEKASALVAPKNARGISGFVFDIIEDESMDISSDVTDHFTENNSYINDHIVNKPITVRLSGWIGELVINRNTGLEVLTNEIEDRLTAIDAYAGEYTAGLTQRLARIATRADRAVQQINNTIDRSGNLIGLLDGEEGVFLSRQKEAYLQLYTLRETKQLLNVTLPWVFLTNMVITNISPSQGNDTEQWTEFSVTLKQLRFSEIQRVDFDQNLFPPREEIQKSEESDEGINQGQEDRGFLDRLGEEFGI